MTLSESNAIERRFLFTYISQEGSCHTPLGHRGSTRFGQELELGDSLGHRLHWGFCTKGEACRESRSELTSVDNVGGFWARGVVSNGDSGQLGVRVRLSGWGGGYWDWVVCI